MRTVEFVVTDFGDVRLGQVFRKCREQLAEKGRRLRPNRYESCIIVLAEAYWRAGKKLRRTP